MAWYKFKSMGKPGDAEKALDEILSKAFSVALVVGIGWGLVSLARYALAHPLF